MQCNVNQLLMAKINNVIMANVKAIIYQWQ